VHHDPPGRDPKLKSEGIVLRCLRGAELERAYGPGCDEDELEQAMSCIHSLTASYRHCRCASEAPYTHLTHDL